MSLVDQYKIALQQPDMTPDPSQEQAIEKLEALSTALTNNKTTTYPNLLTKALQFFSGNAIEDTITHGLHSQGIYLWGDVGRGKTWLMNLFFENLTIKEKQRIHFHHFMLDIHEKLGDLKKQKNPLQQIAKQLAKKYRVLCIDEFIVTNITDAMILSELLHSLFKHQVCLVATSNRIPDDLYLNGLQRERFLPAIELIKTHTEVIHLNGNVDHRATLLELADVYYYPESDDTHKLIFQRMKELAITAIVADKTLNVLNRDITTFFSSEEVVWFDFDVICSAPRAAQDYIELAQQFNTIIISNIPIMNEYADDKARRFIYLIDELYDRNVKLIASAAAEPEKLYQGSMLKFAFQRTSSRLIEMRTHHYINVPHNPF